MSSDRDPTDEQLIARFVRDADAGAFSALVQRHERRVYNIALRMLGRPEDARDAAQDVFLTCVRKLAGFRGGSAFTTWLHRVTVNTCYDHLRRRREHLSLDDAVPDRPVPDRSDEVAAAADVQRALLLVPREFRVVLILRDIQGLGYDQIAEALGAPVGTVKSRLHRGRVALARVLRGEPFTQPAPSNIEETTT